MAPSPQPHNRHRSSIEGVINFAQPPLLSPEQRAHAKRKFYNIVNHFLGINHGSEKYNRPLLSMALSIDEDDVDFSDAELEEELGSTFSNFAEYLLDNFFLPLMASTRKTPQPSPAFLSATLSAQGGDQLFLGTLERVAALRGECLIRDRHRCVVSRKFDAVEAQSRYEKCGQDARDDDANLLRTQTDFDAVEVAHILPHSLTEFEPGSSELTPIKKAALAILNMFDHGVLELINGHEIDRPRNAITLTLSMHILFGNFDVYFTPEDSPNARPHTYKVESFLPSLLTGADLPITRTLFTTDTRTVEPPSPRLFAVHRAIAHVLHLSAAGDYIDKLLREFEEKGVQHDGSTELDRFVRLRLGGWYDGAVDSY